MFKRNYYMLNFGMVRPFECREMGLDLNNIYNTINEMKYSDLIEKHYSNNKIIQEDELHTFIAHPPRLQENDLHTIIAHSPRLSSIYNKLEKLTHDYKEQLKKINDIRHKLPAHYKKQFKQKYDNKQAALSLYCALRYIAYLRELDLLAVREKVYLNLTLHLDESSKGLDIFENYVEYFSKLGMTNADVLIRCSTENMWLITANTNKFLPMIDYEDLLYYFFNTARKLP
jgi:hypothetical protein